MSWCCSRCGETHEDAFRSCWRCSAARPISRAELAEEQQEAQAEAKEVAAVEAELERSDAAAAYEDAAGWNPPVLGDRSVQVGMALHRLVVAFRLCRERQHAGTRTARPDLDRLWTHFFLACGVLGGLLLSELTGFSWLAHLAPNRTVFGLVYVGALVLCVATGHRVVGRELRAAAEAAVRQGRRPVRRVT